MTNVEQLQLPQPYDRLLVVGVDIQNDFCPGGALAVTDGDKIIEPFNRVAEFARQQIGNVALTADWHPLSTSHFNQWPVHCVAGTEGAAFHPNLKVEYRDRMHHDYILRKGTGPDEDAYSGFEAAGPRGETLAELMIPHKDTIAVLIGGLATDYCVKATVLDAVKVAKRLRTVDVYVIEDAIAAVNIHPDDGKEAIAEMKAAGAQFVKTEDIIAGKVLEVRE